MITSTFGILTGHPCAVSQASLGTAADSDRLELRGSDRMATPIFNILTCFENA